MTTPSWPAELNSYAQRGTWNLTPSEPLLRTDFEEGPARVRRRFTSRVSTAQFSIDMSSSDFEAFKSFFQHVLLDGAKWFTLSMYAGGDGYEVHTVRFTEPYAAKDLGFRRVLVSVKVETRDLAVVDELTGFILGEYGQSILTDVSDPLQVIVNSDYPDAVEEY